MSRFWYVGIAYPLVLFSEFLAFGAINAAGKAQVKPTINFWILGGGLVLSVVLEFVYLLLEQQKGGGYI